MEKEQVQCHDFSLGLFIHPAGAEDNKPKWHLINRVRNNRFEELRCRVEIIWQPGEENRNKEGWTFLLFPLSSSKQKFFFALPYMILSTIQLFFIVSHIVFEHF